MIYEEAVNIKIKFNGMLNGYGPCISNPCNRPTYPYVNDVKNPYYRDRKDRVEPFLKPIKDFILVLKKNNKNLELLVELETMEDLLKNLEEKIEEDLKLPDLTMKEDKT